MKALTRSESFEEKGAVPIELPIKVCMHVLEIARTDGRVMRAATALKDAGFVVSVVDIESESDQSNEIVRGVCLKHVKVSRSFMARRFSRWGLIKALLLFLRSTLRLVLTPADVYHAHDITALPACYIAALIRRKPLIFDAHELPLKELEGTGRRSLRVVLTPLLVSLIRRSTRIITSSPLYAREIHNCYHIAEVSLIRNLPPYRIVPKSDRLRQHLGLSLDKRIALYQGNIQADRGLDVLVRAAPFLEKAIVIVMMGKGVEPTLSELKALIDTEGVADRVRILPPVSYVELLDWTASADIGLNVLPPDYSLSIRYSLPNKLFEYLMAGLPVLSSPLDATAEVIRTYEAGQIVSSLAPADVALAINAMLADTGALAHMRHNGLDAAQREFCWEKESDQLIALYRKILALPVR